MSVIGRMTIGGLCGLGVPSSKKFATAFLIDAEQVPHVGKEADTSGGRNRLVGAHEPLPRHLPLLLVHRRHIHQNYPECLRAREVPDLSKHVKDDWLDDGAAAYLAWNIKGCNLSILEHAGRPNLSFSKAKRPGPCPANGDWSSMDWFVRFNALNSSRLNTTSKLIAASVEMRDGLLQGTRPIERAAEDQIFKAARLTQVFTDAALHQWKATSDVTLVVKVGDKEICRFRPNPHRDAVDLLVLNLPDQVQPASILNNPADPAHHFVAFYHVLKKIPSPSKMTIPKKRGTCGRSFVGGSFCMSPTMSL